MKIEFIAGNEALCTMIPRCVADMLYIVKLRIKDHKDVLLYEKKVYSVS